MADQAWGRYTGVLAQAPQPHPTTGKPMLLNPDGSVSTEETITIEVNGRHIVLPTIVNGQRYLPPMAVEMYRRGLNKPVGEFGSAAEAEAFARRRSMELGGVLQQNPRK